MPLLKPCAYIRRAVALELSKKRDIALIASAAFFWFKGGTCVKSVVVYLASLLWSSCNFGVCIKREDKAKKAPFYGPIGVEFRGTEYQRRERGALETWCQKGKRHADRTHSQSEL